MNDRVAKIANILLEWHRELGSMEEWCDEVWEGIEEGIYGVYYEEWKDLLDWEYMLEE